MLAHSFLIESSSKLLVTRTGIKARTSLISSWIRLFILELLALEWRKFYTFEFEYLLRPVGQSWSNFMCRIIGGGERLHNVLRKIGSKVRCQLQQNFLLTYNDEKSVSTFSRLLMMSRSFLYWQVTRTCIKSRTSSNFGQIRPLTTDLSALERLKNPKDL